MPLLHSIQEGEDLGGRMGEDGLVTGGPRTRKEQAHQEVEAKHASEDSEDAGAQLQGDLLLVVPPGRSMTSVRDREP
jgi:hypothetical protein